MSPVEPIEVLVEKRLEEARVLAAGASRRGNGPRRMASLQGASIHFKRTHALRPCAPRWDPLRYSRGIGAGIAGIGAGLLAAGIGLFPAGGLVPSSAACWSEVRTLPASPTARMNARR